MVCIIRISVLFILALLVLLPIGCAGISLHSQVTGFDTPAKPEESIVLRAKVKAPGVFLLPNFPWRTVEFYEGERLLGTAVTDLDGMASLPCSFSEEGFHRVTVGFAGDHERGVTKAFLWVLVARQDQPFLVVDIDNTICESTILEDIFTNVSRRRPVEGAAETLEKLSARYEIIYLTARDESMITKTREWLEKNGFPKGIILARDLDILTLSSTRYKSGVLRDLNRRFTNVCAGIGNRESDGKAFRRNGLLAILFHENERDMREVYFIKDWKEVTAALGNIEGKPGQGAAADHSTE